MELDSFNDFLEATIEAGEFTLSDVGSLITLALLEAKDDYPLAMSAIQKAAAAFAESPTVESATDIFDAAIHHLEEFSMRL